MRTCWTSHKGIRWRSGGYQEGVERGSEWRFEGSGAGLPGHHVTPTPAAAPVAPRSFRSATGPVRKRKHKSTDLFRGAVWVGRGSYPCRPR
eukprot:1196151-Prorocentrum_minimum.AAC.9